MGLSKWVARKGAVGGTARWVATGYNSWRATNEGIDGFLDFLMQARFGGTYHPEAVAIMDRVNDEAGLALITKAILCVEAGFDENTAEHKAEFMEVIQEELAKASVPKSFI